MVGVRKIISFCFYSSVHKHWYVLGSPLVMVRDGIKDRKSLIRITHDWQCARLMPLAVKDLGFMSLIQKTSKQM
jgi:hypothetical protein